MSKILVAEAIKLEDTLKKKIAELIQERQRGLTAIIEKGEQAEYPTRTVDLITSELAEVRKDLRDVKNIVRESNRVSTVDWDGGKLPIDAALDLAKDIRAEAGEAQNMGLRQKQVRDNASRFNAVASTPTFTVALYEPDQYRAKGAKLSAMADKLSMLIQLSNSTVEVEVPFAEKYMIV